MKLMVTSSPLHKSMWRHVDKAISGCLATNTDEKRRFDTKRKELSTMFCSSNWQAHCSELNESQLQIDRRAVGPLQRVIKAYNQGGDGSDDWKFCLQPATVVSEIVMKKAIRGENAYGWVLSSGALVSQQSACKAIFSHIKKLISIRKMTRSHFSVTRRLWVSFFHSFLWFLLTF